MNSFVVFNKQEEAFFVLCRHSVSSAPFLIPAFPVLGEINIAAGEKVCRACLDVPGTELDSASSIILYCYDKGSHSFPLH